MDTNDPSIKLDDKGERQYCKMYDNIDQEHPTGAEGEL